MLRLKDPRRWSSRASGAVDVDPAGAGVAHQSTDLLMTVSRDGLLLRANRAVSLALGIPPDDVLGRNVIAFVHPDDVERVSSEFFDLRECPGATNSDVARLVSPTRGTRVIEFISTNCLDNPDVGGILINGRDVTDHERLGRAYAMLAESNDALLRLDDIQSIYEAICRIAIDRGGCLGAWVTLDGNGAYGVTTSYGVVPPIEIVQAIDAARGAAHHYWCDDVAADPSAEPWSAAAMQAGIVAVATTAFRSRGVPAGSITLVARERGAFDDQMRSVLGQIADGVTFTLDWSESEAARQRAEDAVSRMNAELEQLVHERAREHERTRVATRALLESEQRFRLAFEENMAPMLFTDLNDMVIDVNDAFCKMLGRSREEFFGHNLLNPFTHPDDLGITEEAHRKMLSGEVTEVRYVKRYIHKDGHVIVAEVLKAPAHDADGNTLYFVISERDITDERALTAQLSYQALHDPLTGLPNRLLFEDRLSQAHARLRRRGGLGAVLLLDLDDFKGVNDTLGHLIGDQLLIAIARRFEKVTRSTDTLSRFGGDEFLYLAEGLTSAAEAEDVAMRILSMLSDPFSIDGTILELHASIGVVVFDGSNTDHAEVIRDADVAMFEAKRQVKGHHVLFTPKMHQQLASQFRMLQELRTSLEAGELSMHYQPVVDLSSLQVVGYEALMRWKHPEHGWVPPNTFIALAEQNELIYELGSFALHEATAATSLWTPSGAPGESTYIGVNLSARQFHDPALTDKIDVALSASGLSPDRLIIEITESVALSDVDETSRVIDHFDRLGIGIALDDFGTGYSSFSYLMDLHPRIIKIDQSFVRPPRESARSDVLLETIISLGNRLGLTVVAEGIETVAQLDRLRSFGCELGQGYLFSPAVPASEAGAMLAEQPPTWGLTATQPTTVGLVDAVR